MTLALTRATEAHLPHALSLLAAQLDEHSIAIEPEALRRAVLGLLERPERGALLLAFDGDRAVGVACLAFVWTLEHGGLSAWLDELYVVPALRNQGTGRALLLAAIDLARSRGCLAVDLEVEQDHARAASLYLREGFSAHRRSRYVRHLMP